ncbi:MAG: N-acetylglutaminylglutamine amidotransferase [Proteobacteria bacterium]|nr:MAG: N-acetylglutaminylglutamine amidotransferase [Pseudomonadota bacterium]QKK11930.1 MAG: N-acetylglutaminylglutamine amidotransferase [Pseudomonadota bacterium]
MCGIAGEIRFDHGLANSGAVAAMNAAQAPRGPDASGLFHQGRFAFGHRRLKIVDLSEHAQQPMVDSELGLGIVFNGMIYNYPELRRELEGKGYRFFSTGDTEVVLKAYHAWGEDFVQRFHGMFAFAIWERDSGRALLGRDRLGIKPLYYTQTAGALRFASTLPALLQGGGIDTAIDEVALHHYMTFHSVVPAPLTILKGARKLPPATLMHIEADGRTRQRCYWSLRFERGEDDERRSFGEWQALLTDALMTAVKRRLVADVPVGVLLSGGVDSSLIVGMLAEQGQQGLNTFSIGFESVNDEEGDEFQYSDLVAERFATAHHKIRIDARETLEELPRCIRAMSEPMVSHDNIGFFLLSREVAKHVKVVQSGQGADEVFGGYHWYPPLMGSHDPVADYARVFFDRDHAEYCRVVAEPLCGADHSGRFLSEHFAQDGAQEPLDKALRIDTTIMLVDDPVKRVDSQTMSWGLEARVPFLDHELVELAARIPAEHKVAAGGKYILKEVARNFIPQEVIDRPKGYFPVPALKYLQGPFLEYVRDALGNRAARERGLFNAPYVEALFAAPEEHITPLRGSKLWQVALLELWLQGQGV